LDVNFLKFVGCILGVGLSIYLVFRRHASGQDNVSGERQESTK
jgi:hypothetical protein